jgi:hypothetical protein
MHSSQVRMDLPSSEASSKLVNALQYPQNSRSGLRPKTRAESRTKSDMPSGLQYNQVRVHLERMTRQRWK